MSFSAKHVIDFQNHSKILLVHLYCIVDDTYVPYLAEINVGASSPELCTHTERHFVKKKHFLNSKRLQNINFHKILNVDVFTQHHLYTIVYWKIKSEYRSARTRNNLKLFLIEKTMMWLMIVMPEIWIEWI